MVDGATLYYAMQPSCKLDFLDLACSSKVVVACRTAPLQKAEVVALVKDNRDVMTLSIGEAAAQASLHRHTPGRPVA